MRKAKEDGKGPNEPTRFPVVITLDQRQRLRVVAAMLGKPMERMGGDWLIERLASEEKRLGIPQPPPAGRK